MKIIYDIGANSGDNIAYYLQKSNLVVAVEANPALCGQIRHRFANEIAAGRLALEECVVTIDEPGEVPFFLHREYHILGQFPRPEPALTDHFDEIVLPSKNIIDIIKKYGDPYYIKIDVERYDQYILRCIFQNEIFPSYISAELHQAEVFGLLVGWGPYRAFKIVDGSLVHVNYEKLQIDGLSGPGFHSFPWHSAGPLGNDIPGPWLSSDSVFAQLAQIGLGWRDLHASRVDTPDP